MYLLGLDIGSTGCKSIIFTIEGEIVSSAYEEYRFYHPKPGWTEMNPGEVWSKVVSVLKKSIARKNVDPECIQALSVSTLGGGFFPVDKRGNWLYPCIHGYDNRSEKQVKELRKKIDELRFFEITGAPLSHVFALSKIMWLRENIPNMYKNVSKILEWEDYAFLRLCDEAVTDYSIASETGMFNVEKKRWSSEVLDVAGIDENLLPEAMPSGTIVGEIPSEAAKDTGLAKGTMVVTGGHDVACGALGVGAIEEGIVMDITGTVGIVCSTILKPIASRTALNHGFINGCHVVKDAYYIYDCILTVGSILRWYRDNFAKEELDIAEKSSKNIYDLLMEEASIAVPGSSKLFLLPDFAGSISDSNSRGVLLGLTLGHRKNDIIRAIVEGVTFELRSSLDALMEEGVKLVELRAIGGGSKSPFWLQLKADITEKKIVVPIITEATALGAAILAGVGIKVYPSVHEAVHAIYKQRESYQPSELSKKYEKYYQIYKRIRPSLKSVFSKLKSVD